MPGNHLMQAIRRFIIHLTKAKDRPDARPRLYARTLPSLLNTSKLPQEIVSALFAEALKHNASDINIEPTEEKRCDIFFRINGYLRKIASVNSQVADKLRSALLNQSQAVATGKYGVRERTIAIDYHDKSASFLICTIPQQQTDDCILIKPCSAAHSPKKPLFPRANQLPKQNIDKKIFIWQMGKVGSLSVYTSLLPHSRPTSWQVPSIRYDTDWPRHNNIIQTHSVKLLYDFLHYSNEEFVIISLVRDLMARNISTIFQSMNFTEKWRNHFYIASASKFMKMPYEQQERAITKHLYTLNTSTKTTQWYDNLLKSHYYYPDIDRYLIDIYAKPFDQDKGLQIYESMTKRVQMIILRMEDLTAGSKELGEFLGIENFHLTWGNTPEGKWYDSIYKRFKERYRPTAEEIETIYNSRFMRYFYSNTQIENLTKKWRHPSSTG